MFKGYSIFIIGLGVWLILLPGWAGAQTLQPETEGLDSAVVVEVIDSQTVTVPATEIKSVNQTLRVKILTGEEKGRELLLENDYSSLRAGDKFFLKYVVQNGERLYTINDLDRRGPLLWLVIIFGAVVIGLSGWQGVRSLISLVFSLGLIIWLLLPWLLAGAPPVLVSSTVAIIVLSAAIFTTHGFNRQSLAALGGTVGAVILTGLLAAWAIDLAALSGLATDEAVYLNLGTGGQLNFQGILLGAMIIGMLGVLDDIAITQTALVAELKHLAPGGSKKDVYYRALRVGREHVGALVNTLVLAYTGAALPLLLLFSTSTINPIFIVNREVFATEIVRMLIGSIGLVLTVPLSTLLAIWWVPAGDSKHHH